MTLRHLEIFVAVCDRMNMTAAAGDLFLSQSAVSQAVAELESHYGVRLFERLSRRLYLTEAGGRLLSYGRHILRMSQDAEGELRALSRGGTVRVGASVTIGTCVLPRLAADFLREYPQCRVEVVEDNTAGVEALLLGDRLDLGLVEGSLTSGDLVGRPFTEDRLVLLCGPEHPLAGRDRVEPGELEGRDFILREVGSGTRRTFETGMARLGLSWREVWTCSNTDTIKAAVMQGLGLSVLSLRAVEAELEAGTLHQLEAEGLSFLRRFQVVHHQHKFLTPAMSGFMACCFSQGEREVRPE